jgi:class 3 adenylate cyclase
MQLPETRYAVRPDGVSLAYQVVGDGPLTLICCWGFISHLDLLWGNPGCARFYRGLASFSRLVLFDKAGTGVSDPIPRVATLEERAADIGVVMDAVGADRAALFGESEGGPSAMLFAATRPQRTTALVLYGSLVKGLSDRPSEEPWALAPEVVGRYESLVRDWGKGLGVDLFAPSQASATGRFKYATFERAAVSPSMARALVETIKGLDVSEVARALSVPTLVIHVRGDRAVPVAAGRYLASTIPGAEYVELDGEDHAYNGTSLPGLLAATERFLTGRLTPAEPDRVLATIVFTDMVDSTARAAQLGDAGWRAVLERCDAMTRAHVEGSGGRVVKSLGDGTLATLPGPATAIRCARNLLEEADALGVQLRVGIHTGECEAIGDDLGGLAVHIGARIAASANPSEVLVSSTVKELVVGSALRFADRGRHSFKGVPGSWRLFALVGDREGDAEAPDLEPAAAHMTRGDRMMVGLARRTPRAMRAFGKVMPGRD